MADQERAALLARGTLYKALGRMSNGGLLDSEWEAPERAEAAGRPRRRLYRVTGAGAAALRAAMRTASLGAATRPAVA